MRPKGARFVSGWSNVSYYISLSLINCLPSCGDGFIVDVVVVVNHSVDNTLGSQLDHTVRHCANELMVVTAKEYISLKCCERIVKRLDGFQVKVIGRRIQNQHVCTGGEHHFGNHTAHSLATAQYGYALIQFFSVEKHPAEVSFDEYIVGILSILA